jgi:hypothetical protein
VCKAKDAARARRSFWNFHARPKKIINQPFAAKKIPVWR